MRINNIQILIQTWLYGYGVGQDEFGNKYYQDRRYDQDPRRYFRRWVIYAQDADPTGIPATWYGWLHHITNSILLSKSYISLTQKHQKNLTGRFGAYFPPTLDYSGNLAKEPIKRYEAWQPYYK